MAGYFISQDETKENINHFFHREAIWFAIPAHSPKQRLILSGILRHCHYSMNYKEYHYICH